MEPQQIPVIDPALVEDFFRRLPRQGPGSEEATLCAWKHVGFLPEDARIADIGCGTGGQTLTLARHTGAQITALDISAKFVADLNARAAQAGVDTRLRAIAGSMENLPFAPETFDLIWSEGAVYHIGFGRGLREWRQYLRPGGTVAVTELSWLKPVRPEEIERYFADNGIAPHTAVENLRIMERAGYLPSAHFVLPETCWTDNYYRPMERVMDAFLDEHAHSAPARHFVERMREEIDFYDRYGDCFGYVFYIGRRD
ncbi:class I SAM-dependent methyltransferase [Rikenella microfusus]|uniref:class I SAM-dependent methyltransferase n=1 Tax=Rikenella microfusus TaxID=28139 RepID=UPI003A91C2B1